MLARVREGDPTALPQLIVGLHITLSALIARWVDDLEALKGEPVGLGDGLKLGA